MSEPILETTAYLNKRIAHMPQKAVILGTGLGNLAEAITDKEEIPYGEIPHFIPLSFRTK